MALTDDTPAFHKNRPPVPTLTNSREVVSI